MRIYFSSLRVEKAKDVFLDRSHHYKYGFLQDEMHIKYVCSYVQLLIQQILGQTDYGAMRAFACVHSCALVCPGHLFDSFLTTFF